MNEIKRLTEIAHIQRAKPLVVRSRSFLMDYPTNFQSYQEITNEHLFELPRGQISGKEGLLTRVRHVISSREVVLELAYELTIIRKRESLALVIYMPECLLEQDHPELVVEHMLFTLENFEKVCQRKGVQAPALSEFDELRLYRYSNEHHGFLEAVIASNEFKRKIKPRFPNSAAVITNKR